MLSRPILPTIGAIVEGKTSVKCLPQKDMTYNNVRCDGSMEANTPSGMRVNTPSGMRVNTPSGMGALSLFSNWHGP